MPRPLKKDRLDCSWKSQCPYCPYDAGASKTGAANTHNLRKHIHNKHKEPNLTFIDSTGCQMNRVSDTIAIKYHPVKGKYGQGFCFKCCSYIFCGSSNPTTKLSFIGSHTCAEKQVREYKSGGTNPKPKERRVMTDTDAIAALLTKYGIEVMENEDDTVDLDKTLRFIKAKQDEVPFIVQLRRSKKYQQVIVPMLHKAMQEHEDMYADWDTSEEDPDDPSTKKPLFDENIVLWQLMPGLLSAETKETHKDKIIMGLRIEKDQMEDRLDQSRIELSRVKQEYETKIQRMTERFVELSGSTEKGDGGDVIAHE